MYTLKASPAIGQSGIYNIPVTYTDGSKKIVTIKITMPTLNYWTKADKASARTKLLVVINGFRSAVNVSPVTLDTTPEHQTYLNQRAAEKAKQFAETGATDHSGKTLYKQFGVISDEDLGYLEIDAGLPLKEQVKRFVTYTNNTVQAEKDDYEAINIRHERHNLTNPPHTVGHYLGYIDSSSKKFVIGIGTYTSGNAIYVASVMSGLN